MLSDPDHIYDYCQTMGASLCITYDGITTGRSTSLDKGFFVTAVSVLLCVVSYVPVTRVT